MRASGRGWAAWSVLCLCAAFAPGGARGTELDAPLAAGTEGPIRMMFLDMTGGDARPVARPELGLRWQAANDWSTQTMLGRGTEVAYLQLDGQSDTFTLAATAPWTLWSRRFSTTVEARVTLWSGGWSDGLVEWWHGVAHFTNFQRQHHPRDRLNVMLVDGNGASAFDLRTATWNFGHVVARNQALIASGGTSLRAEPNSARPRPRWAVSGRVDVKLPIGSPSNLGGSGGTDAGVGLLATAELARWCVVHANVFTSAWSRFSRDVELQPVRFHHGGEVSFAFVPGSWAVLLEDRVLSPIFPGDWKARDLPTYKDVAASATYAATRWHNQISVGFRKGWFTTWFSEDITPGRSAGTHQPFFNSNAPDITLGVEASHAL